MRRNGIRHLEQVFDYTNSALNARSSDVVSRIRSNAEVYAMAETDRERTKQTSFWQYWKECGKRFLKDATPWARDNIFWGTVVLVVPPLAVWIKNRGNNATSLDWETVKTTLYLYALVLSGYIFIHGVRTPWKVHQDQEQINRTLKETVEGGKRNPHLGPKWDNFIEKLGQLDSGEKHVLYQFVMQGCSMQEGHGQQLYADKCHIHTNPLGMIQQKTHFITPRGTIYEANPGIAQLLEHWAKTYEPESS
jgi:hypothetical protein